ncbi:MAG: carbamoyltransferase HypF [Sulfurimonas sp.]|nr:carbamoyltransferase HypF [Sulfurimonas sp.]MBU3939365.1 carbamoyltransferase HypF [bacterium]MBU4060148.1 carbamoyltransferase HypF [bacterium]MBU4110885.1 carbamoyltransferase HypF [bacterium]
MIKEGYFIQGVVQGVGFRPFVYKMAHELNLKGFVKNSATGVSIEVQGQKEALELFQLYLSSRIPPLTRIDSITKTQLTPTNLQSFEIIQSDTAASSKSALVSPDIAICKECLQDVKNAGKYHNYFATNCTNCGPRYSIIQTVPYDRKQTSMSKFEMCSSCQEEYANPLNRRYHAQPISCNSCGPTLSQSIGKTAAFINNGKIVAIKGIGGFHIVCDASNHEVVLKLREFKNRPSKPFAIMCRDAEQVQEIATVNVKELELLTSKEAPIVILDKIQNAGIKLSAYVAPNINRIGCFLPYTALHHLLFKLLKNPIVATSANLGNEPIITDSETLMSKLPFVEFILDFDRDIINGVDDSLVQVIAGKKQTLRLARGYAPKVIKLPYKSEKKILAVGANAKNSVAFVIDDQIIISPHIGDLDSSKAFGFFERTIETFKNFYDFEPELIVHDKHPSYMSTKWAKTQGKKLVAVQHHLAHIYAAKAEFGLHGDYLGFSFDGTGYGEEKVNGEAREAALGQGTLWGGEVFVGDTRKYSFKTIKLLGGEKAIKEPRRVALSMLFEKYTLEMIMKLPLACVTAFSAEEIKILHQSYSKNLNAPLSSSVGRMFDAVASFANLLQFQSYEGEAGLICEQNYKPQITEAFEYKIVDGIIDIAFDFFDKEIVSKFINTLVNIVIEIAKTEKMEVILSGGVFQNKTLLELLIKEFEEEKVTYYVQEETAINDGGIALGQLYYYLSARNIIGI